MKYDITALGDILIDFSPMGVDEAGDPVFVRKAGGAPLNLLATVAKFGGKAAFIGKVGEDMFGRYLAQVLRDNGIDDGALVMDPHHNTTLAFVQLDASGDRDFDFCRKTGADTYLDESEVDADQIRQSRVFHFGSLSFTAETARRASLHALKIAQEAGCIITYDPNYRAPLWDSEESAIRWMREGIAFANITKVSKEEAQMIAGASDVDDCIQYIQNLGVSVVLVTDGANGIRYGIGSHRGFVPATPVKAVDTTGAGDIFFGTFLTCFLRGGADLDRLTEETVRKYIEKAAQIAAQSTKLRGAIASIPEFGEDIQ